MRSAYLKDFFRLIKTSFGRFLAIVAITALGVAFFAGLRATAPHMRAVGTSFLSEHNYLDIRALSTIGFNEEDIQALRQSVYISFASGEYSLDALCEGGRSIVSSRIFSIPMGQEDKRAINSPWLISGRMPMHPNECLAHPDFMRRSGLDLGSKVIFSSGTSDPISDFLNRTEYLITGTAYNPTYLTDFPGPNKVGNGRTEGYFYIMAECFEYEVYTEAFVKVSERIGDGRFSVVYENVIDRAVDSLKPLGEDRSITRYNEIRDEALDKIADAKKEIRDAYKEIADAQKQLDDAKKALKDGWNSYYKGRDELASGIASGQKQLDSAKKTIDDGWSEYNENYAIYEEQISSAQAELDEGYSEYYEALAQVEYGYAEIEKAMNDMASMLMQQQLGDGQGELITRELFAGYTASMSDLGRSGYQPNEQESVQYFVAPQEPPSVPVAAYEQEQPPSETTGSHFTDQAVLTEDPAEEPDMPTDSPEMPQEPDTQEPDTQEPDTQEPDTQEPDTQDPDTQEPDTQDPDTQEPETQEPETQEPDEGQPVPPSPPDQPAMPPGEMPIPAELQAKIDELDAAKAQLDAAKAKLDEGQAELDAARSEAEAEFAAAYSLLTEGEAEWQAGVAALEKSRSEGQAALDKAFRELREGQSEYDKASKEFEEEKENALIELADAEIEVADAEEELAEFEVPKWHILAAKSNSSFSGFKQDATQIDAISKVLPLVFFIIASFVAMASMTRLVENERTYIGTLKALGFSNSKIALRYIAYALIASVIGSVCGFAVGSKLFPVVIYDAFSNLYIMPAISPSLSIPLAVASCGAAIASTVLPAYFVLQNSLRESPADLMRPAAPKAGKRALLESIGFIWSRLSFYSKLSARNVFRYKKRLFMTITGIAGCTSLIFTGFSLHDAITTVVGKQFVDLFKYDIAINYENKAEDGVLDEARSAIYASDAFASVAQVRLEAGEVEADGVIKNVYLIIPQDENGIGEFYNLRDRVSKKPHTLNDSGALISEKFARD
ncbi:MAG: hypothetical protein FWG30_09305, partial [Eubacteriaceae bacterium]|nr:hypothetical protein [Eubacteriaceae bacterium]